MELTELGFAIEAGSNVISVQTQLTERPRMIEVLCQKVAETKGLPCYLWNLGSGGLELLTSSTEFGVANAEIERFHDTDPVAVLKFLSEKATAGVFILEDLHPFLGSTATDIASRIARERIASQIVNITQAWTNHAAKYLILLGSKEIELPATLANIVPEIWNPLPDYETRLVALCELLPNLGIEAEASLASQLALAAGGLTLEEIRFGLRLIVVKHGKPKSATAFVKDLIDYKVDRLKAFNLSFTPKPNVSNFGGMDQIRNSIEGVKKDYSHQARQMDIPLPKGWLFVGPPGTGKTFVSKFCASILDFPMISVDTGAVAAEGASYLRRLIDRVEAAAPALVYFDELDKLFPDPGVAADVNQRQVLGFLLTWLQDKTSHTFVVATLNRLDSLPPELTRLGRFDEIFYVGFPQAYERKEILHLHLARFDPRYRNGHDPLTTKDWRIILNHTINCTGAELSIMIEKAAKKQFHAGLAEFQLGREEILAAREEITPLYIRDTDRILKIENIAKYVAKPSSSVDRSIFAPPPITLWGQKLEPSSSESDN